MENAASGTVIDLSSTRSHSMLRKNHQDTTNRYLKSPSWTNNFLWLVCLLFFIF
jgi:hypothetical protein